MSIKEFARSLFTEQNASYSNDRLAQMALKLERQRVRATMSKFEDTFRGSGDFAETGIFRCGLLMAFSGRNNWTFRHVSPASEYYIYEAVSQVVETAEPQGRPATYKLVAGSPYLAERIVTSLESKGRTVEAPNMFIEVEKGEDDFGCQEKQVIHLASQNQTLIHLLKDQNVVRL